MKQKAWRPLAADGPGIRLWTHRVLPMVLVAGAVVLFFVLLYSPFYHPRVYLLFAAAEYPESLIPGGVTAAEDMAALPVGQVELINESGEDQSPRIVMESPAAFDAILDQLNRHKTARRDVVIAWIRGQAISFGGQVDLICGDYDPQDAQAGRYPLAEVLKRVGECSAGTKLLVLDVGRLAHAPRLGIFAECSPQAIREAVEGSNDPTLWVLLSHTDLETSRTLAEPRCSALAHFAGEGLRRAADTNQDAFIDLPELRDYIQGQLESRATGPSQTTALVWGGGEITAATAFPRLAPVTPPTLEDASKAISEAAGKPLPGPLAQLQEKEATEKPESEKKPANVELLAEAWSLHDRLATLPQLRPVDAAPHLFRALQDRLRGFDSILRSGDNPAEADALRRLVGQMKDLAEGRAPQRFERQDLVPDLAEVVEKLDFAAAAHSLAMAEMAAKRSGPALPAEIVTAAARLDAFATSGDRAEFQKWSAGLPAKYDSYAEFRLVRALAARPDLPWPSVQLALRACRLAETAAAETLESGDWTRPLIDECDRLRSTGERNLMYPVRRGDAGRVTADFQKAIAGYEQALAAAREVTALEARTNEALFYLFDCVRWSIGSIGVEADAPSASELSELLRALSEAINLLDRPSTVGWADLGRARRQLEVESDQLRQRIAARESLHEGAASGASTAQTKRVAGAENSAAAVRLRLMILGDPQSIGASAGRETATPASPQERLMRLRQYADFYGRAVRLVVGELFPDDPTVRAAKKPPRESRFTQAEFAVNTAEALYARGGTKDVWVVCGQLGEALREFYRALPPVIETLLAANRDLTEAKGRAEKIRGLRAARRLMYLLHACDVQRLEQKNVWPMLRAAQLYDWLVWHQRRLLSEVDDAPAVDSQYLTDAAAGYRQAAMRVPRQPPVDPIGPPRIEVDAPQRVDLAENAEREFAVTVINRDKQSVDVWLLADYDPELLVVAPRNDQTLYDQPTMETSADGTTAAPGAARRPVLRDGLRPTFRIDPEEKRLLWVNVRRKGLASEDARLIIRALSRADCVRQELMVELARRRPVDLVLDGETDRWERTESALVLYPLPNRQSSYKLSLVNTTAEGKLVNFEILRVDEPTAVPPLGEVSAALADECLTRMKVAGAAMRLEKVPVPVGNKPTPISFAPAAAPKPKEQPKPGAAGDSKGKEEPAKANSASAIPLSRNLVAVITDVATGRRSIQPIDILTQRPARFLLPRAEFDPKRQRVEILVRPVNAATVPAEGIWIEAEPEVHQPEEAPVRQRALLRPGDAETRLFVAVPPDAGPTFPIVVRVDGFERAFRYEVSTDAGSPVVVPPSHRTGIRILKPQVGTAYGPKPAEIEAALEVDAPGGLLLDGKSTVEIGIDADRDRELRGEESLLLTSDRQVELSGELGENGMFAVRTEVSDLHVTLAPSKVKDTRANLIARVRLPDSDVWSDPIELIFDSQPPKLSQVQILPGAAVTEGTVLDLSVLASDGVLSGVGKVEAAFDVMQMGEFVANSPLGSGSLQPDGRWMVKLATEKLNPGLWNVLVRATDRQGNASEYLKVPVKVISKEAAAESQKPGPNRVRGRIVYGRLEKVPVAKARVQLVGKTDAKTAPKTGESKAGDPKPGLPSYEVQTEKDGQFAIEKVVPGEYELSSEALVGGNRRSGRTSLTVPPSPPEMEPVELILRSRQADKK